MRNIEIKNEPKLEKETNSEDSNEKCSFFKVEKKEEGVELTKNKS